MNNYTLSEKIDLIIDFVTREHDEMSREEAENNDLTLKAIQDGFLSMRDNNYKITARGLTFLDPLRKQLILELIEYVEPKKNGRTISEIVNWFKDKYVAGNDEDVLILIDYIIWNVDKLGYKTIKKIYNSDNRIVILKQDISLKI